MQFKRVGFRPSPHLGGSVFFTLLKSSLDPSQEEVTRLNAHSCKDSLLITGADKKKSGGKSRRQIGFPRRKKNGVKQGGRLASRGGNDRATL